MRAEGPAFIRIAAGIPREREKFLLGDRIQTTALDILESLVEATHTKRCLARLAHANLGREKLRFLFRLARDLRYGKDFVTGGRPMV